ncbi:hypothetical protein D3C85_1489720 [compost metagenome]
MRVDAAADVLADFALEQVWGAAGELDHFDTTHDLAHGIGMHLAMFGGDQRGELFGVLFE